MTMLPPILAGAGTLLKGYDVLFCDVWGVVHDGVRAYPAANEALTRFREGGGTVVLVSNAPMPADAVARLLDEKQVTRAAWDVLVTSGDLSLAYVAECGFTRVVKIAYDFDNSLFDIMPVEDVGVEEAQALVCVGMRDHLQDRMNEAFLPMLERAKARGLPFVCANPDLVVDVGGTLVPCAGTLAQLYERIGGDVYWAGKPHAAVYQRAHATAERIRKSPVDRSRIMAIGDSVRTDMAGATGYGVDGLLVAGGIHREVLLADGAIVPAGLARLLADDQPRPIAAVPALSW